MMTSSQHRSGTDRCGEVLRNLEAQGCYYDVVVNVQGDEPFVQQSQLRFWWPALPTPRRRLPP